ncbi:hypothetical protein G5B30_16490 [Sphingobacterium sp. SGG-5]|uniref:hypothetical protein n=1 Tax=Sphingobacterium sp. SGG-5 TaxID=2710881 RepID=UPI0013EC4C91|nr:hypothetical protein [Sphingobacterium sp. SGG-5]NGM63509.1 hypothetical protein [Sphingobacterium sp. SGG-5]
MSTKDRDFLKIGNDRIKGNVTAVSFMDGDFHILYIPSLNLSSYGNTFEEAKQMMEEVVVKDFCVNVLKNKNKGYVISELKKLGWTKSPFFEKDLSKSAYIDKEGILREFELPENTPIREENVQIAC